MRYDFYITKTGVKSGEFTTYQGGHHHLAAKNFYNQLFELCE